MPILKPGYVRWTGTLYTTDPSIEIVGPPGPQGIPGPSGISGSTGTFNCLASLAVLNMVYITGADDTVATAEANSLSTLPTIGIVISKPTTTTAVVQYSGEISGFVGLTTGATYYLSDNTAGAITPLVPTTIGHAVQVLGVARDTTKLVLAIDRLVIL